MMSECSRRLPSNSMDAPNVDSCRRGGCLHVLLAGDTCSGHSVRLASALAGRGLRVSVLNGVSLVRRVRNESGLDVSDLPFEDCRLRGNGRLTAVRWLEGRLNRRRLRSLLLRSGADVVHVNNLYCGEGMDRLASAFPLPLPTVVTAWGSDVDDSVMRKHPAYWPIRRTLLDGATLVTAWSEAMIRRCRSFVPYRPSADFRAIRWYSDPARFNPAAAAKGRHTWRERLGLSSRDLVFLSVRSSRPNYQIDRILRAFARAFVSGHAVDTDARRCVLVVVMTPPRQPGHEEYLAELRRLAVPLSDRVRFLDAVPHSDMPALLGLADAVVSIPAADGGPATYFEAIRCGVPLITADLEDYRGVVVDGENALTVDAGSDESVEAALRRFAADDSLRERLRAGVAASAARHGTFADTIDAYLDAYQCAIVKARYGASIDTCGTGAEAAEMGRLAAALPGAPAGG